MRLLVPACFSHYEKKSNLVPYKYTVVHPIDQIRKRFSSLVPMTEKDWLYFSSRLEHVRFKKSDVITGFGQVENRLFFLANGIVRYIVNNINESTSDFAFPGQFFSSYSSFISRKPSIYELRPVTSKVECYYIGYDHLHEVYRNTNCGERIGRLAAEQQFLKKSAREISLLTLNPREKYLQLLEEQPHLIQSIPLKYLASYLGITPETLSRIRASIS
ncbi:Crp/Fnr family transcriptional regulator [Zunongwangia sp. F363]|uniref:Crp/Fnr family transcriptional regulator n=1 Tax=Autumnicola tepida TaxID=3075595 RepID=A0ABU3CF16_9FLAO|nr:cyclic nucleotide-binding domain-containing protein [Zunongwangia sp. F363]MDT0644817.1 Crp/Fnr family transcriptional regulator [Zunongwangia sp. F363]